MAAGGQTSIALSASCPEGLRQQLYITSGVAQHGIALVVGIANQQHVQRQLAVLCLGSQGMQTAQAASSQQPEAAKLLQVLAAEVLASGEQAAVAGGRLIKDSPRGW